MESFVPCSQWRDVSTKGAPILGVSGMEGRSDTPIGKQPSCFRVCTPFPSSTQDGEVKVVGKNATETDFTFPPLGKTATTSLFGRADATRRCPQGALSESGAAPRAFAAAAWIPTPSLFVAPSPERCLTGRPASETTSETISVRSRISESAHRVGVDAPCRDSLARLSLTDPKAEKTSAEERAFNEATKLASTPTTDAGFCFPCTANLRETVKQRDRQLARAHEQIEGLKETIRTLEFRNKEYAADDGALGLREYLKEVENKNECRESSLEKQIAKEKAKRQMYQNRYYQAVAEKAELQSQLDRALEKAAAPPQAAAPAGTVAVKERLQQSGRKRRITAKRRGPKKMKESARVRSAARLLV